MSLNDASVVNDEQESPLCRDIRALMERNGFAQRVARSIVDELCWRATSPESHEAESYINKNNQLTARLNKIAAYARENAEGEPLTLRAVCMMIDHMANGRC